MFQAVPLRTELVTVKQGFCYRRGAPDGALAGFIAPQTERLGLPGFETLLGAGKVFLAPLAGCMTSATHYPEVATPHAPGDLRLPSGNPPDCAGVAAASGLGRRFVLQCQG